MSRKFWIVAFISMIFSCMLLYKSVESSGKHSLGIKYQFDEFIKNFGKDYVPGSTEYFRRLAVFEQNMRRVNKLNSMRVHNASAVYGVTMFSDLTPDEFRARYLNHKPTSYAPPFSKDGTKLEFLSYKESRGHSQNLPQKFDWRDKKHVTSIKNQGQCGACWAFSSVETIETMHSIKTGNLVTLSVQEVIDCAGEGNYGCHGGDICSALDWMVKTNTSLVTDAKYPLTDTSNSCKIFHMGTKGIGVVSYTCKSYVNQEQAMLAHIANHGPLVVSVDATTWSDYQGGIIMYHCSDYNNHAVQIVGYDLTGDVPYYIVRNSWGKGFGEKGYIYIKINGNICGIAEHVATVDV